MNRLQHNKLDIDDVPLGLNDSTSYVQHRATTCASDYAPLGLIREVLKNQDSINIFINKSQSLLTTF